MLVKLKDNIYINSETLLFVEPFMTYGALVFERKLSINNLKDQMLKHKHDKKLNEDRTRIIEEYERDIEKYSKFDKNEVYEYELKFIHDEFQIIDAEDFKTLEEALKEKLK